MLENTSRSSPRKGFETESDIHDKKEVEKMSRLRPHTPDICGSELLGPTVMHKGECGMDDKSRTRGCGGWEM